MIGSPGYLPDISFPPKTRTRKQSDNVILHEDSSVKMKVFLKILPVTLLAEVVCGQFCTKETLDCSKAVPAITKLGSHSCACDNEMHSGALKFDKGNLYVCLEKKWEPVKLISHPQKDYGFHQENPGTSCNDILAKADGKILKNGIYWIKGKNIAHVSLLQCYLIFLSLPRLVCLVPLVSLNTACIFLIMWHQCMYFQRLDFTLAKSKMEKTCWEIRDNWNFKIWLD